VFRFFGDLREMMAVFVGAQASDQRRNQPASDL
jgi:hypothetical protein